MRRGRLAIAVVPVALLGLLGAESALACSCAPASPRESLAGSDAAIVGRLLGVKRLGPARAEYRYRVVRVYRGAGEIRGGTVAKVRSGGDSASCALPSVTGRNYGLFLIGAGDRWAGGICGVVSPRRLWAAAKGPEGAAEVSTSPGPSCAS